MVKVSIVENITNIKNREIVYIDLEMAKIVFDLVDTNTIDIWDIIILVVSENITEQGWEMVSVYIVKGEVVYWVVKVRVANYTVMVKVVCFTVMVEVVDIVVEDEAVYDIAMAVLGILIVITNNLFWIAVVDKVIHHFWNFIVDINWNKTDALNIKNTVVRDLIVDIVFSKRVNTTEKAVKVNTVSNNLTVREKICYLENFDMVVIYDKVIEELIAYTIVKVSKIVWVYLVVVVEVSQIVEVEMVNSVDKLNSAYLLVILDKVKIVKDFKVCIYDIVKISITYTQINLLNSDDQIFIHFKILINI